MLVPLHYCDYMFLFLFCGWLLWLMIIGCHFTNCYESTNITPLLTQISASKFQNLSQDPIKKRFSAVFGPNTTQITVLITNFPLRRGRIWNLAFQHWALLQIPPLHKRTFAQNILRCCWLYNTYIMWLYNARSSLKLFGYNQKVNWPASSV